MDQNVQFLKEKESGIKNGQFENTTKMNKKWKGQKSQSTKS